jgi:hypothetical protein
LALALFSCPLPRVARADGAFPDSLGVLLPADRPQQIFVATTFGLLRSDDDGATFSYACEEAIGIGATLYQVGPAPDDRLYAVTGDGISVSSDDGCSWTRLDKPSDPTDVFADPQNADRVLAIASATSAEVSTTVAAYSSSDGAKSFDPITDPTTAFLSGIEIARSNPDVIYVSASSFDMQKWRPSLRRSSDAGRHWIEHDLSSQIATATPYILEVDKADDKRVYLRLRGSSGADQFGIYDDATASVVKPLQLNNPMTAFLDRSDGALIVEAVNGEAFISMDRGGSFAHWPNDLHLRALGERDGLLYAAAFDSLDGFAVARSDDQGAHWQPLLRFAQITGPMQCGDLPTQCEIPWQMLQQMLAGPAPIEPVMENDAGIMARPPPTSAASKTSGGCSATEGANALGPSGLVLALVLLLLLRGRRRPMRA